MKRWTMTLLAVLTIAACEKDDDSEWGRVDSLVRKYGNFDASTLPALVAHRVLIAEQKFRIEDRCVTHGPGCEMDGTGDPAQYIFFEDGTMWHCWRYNMPNIQPPYVCEINSWKYEPAVRAFRFRYKSTGEEWGVVVEAVVPDGRLIVSNGELRMVMRIHKDQETFDRFVETYTPYANTGE